MTAPSVSIQSPFSGETGVSRNANVFFRVAGPDGVTLSSLDVQIQVAGGGFVAAVIAGVFQSGWDGPSSSIVAIVDGADSGFDVTVDRTISYPINATTDVRIDADSTLTESMTQVNYSFVVTNVDSVSPSVSSQTPVPDATSVLVGTNISFTVLDDVGGAGLAVKKLKIFVSSAVAYDGAETGVIEGTPATYDLGFFEEFNGAGSSVVVNGNGVDVVVDPQDDFGDGIVIIVSVQSEDKQGNAIQETYSFTTEDLSAPTLANQTPAPDTIDADKTTNILLSVNDNLDGVDIKTVQISVDATLAYDGTDVGVIAGTPSSWVNGFQSGFDDPASAVVANASNGFDFTIDKTTDFTDYDEVTVQVDADDLHSPANSLSTNYQFNVSELGNIHEVRIFGAIVGFSKIEFLRTGTSIKDFEAFASAAQVETESPFRDFIAVQVKPGEDVLIDQAYDLNVVVGSLSEKLVFNGSTEGVKFVP